eukprot:1765339-Amphidinium_carterae.1
MQSRFQHFTSHNWPEELLLSWHGSALVGGTTPPVCLSVPVWRQIMQIACKHAFLEMSPALRISIKAPLSKPRTSTASRDQVPKKHGVSGRQVYACFREPDTETNL